MIMALYTFLTTAALLVLYPAGWIMSLFGRSYIRERLTPPEPCNAGTGPCVWIHAASVGEARIAYSFASDLKKRHPEATTVITTSTPTGQENLRRLMGDSGGDNSVDAIMLAPFDSPPVAEAFYRRVAPTLYVLIETELWPWTIRTMYRHNVPIVLVNGKLSKRAFRRYASFRNAMKKLMAMISLACVQERVFGSRYRNLGVPAERIEVLGNVKFDNLPQPGQYDIHGLRKDFGFSADAKIFCAGSTRPGEEEVLLKAFHTLSGQHEGLILVIAPRHLARLDGVAALVESHGFEYRKRTDVHDSPATGSERVFLLDSMGELMSMFACSEIAFVGGSLRDFGGHNPLEPAALGIPVLFGPYMEQTGAKELLAGGAAALVHSSEEIVGEVNEIIRNTEKASKMSGAGIATVKKFRGIMSRTIRTIEERGIL